jgi:hypothetical protein
MAIKKELTLEATGAVASFHIITHLSLDMLSGTSSATLTSYVSQETFEAGKQPVQGMLPVFVRGVPADDENAVAFLQKALVAAAPETVDAADSALPYASNRYVLAGGSIV